MLEHLVRSGWVRPAYLLVFGASALACFAALRWTDRIEHGDTRRGLRWLLATSGAWASAHVGYLLAPGSRLQYAFFLAGLVVGIAAVGPWLYFCSAYTGRSLHRNRRVRRLAAGVFLAIVAVKLTNPFHGWYFVTGVTAEPFLHLGIEHGPLHWVVMGLAYALSFVGFFMLFELFVRVNSDTGPLLILVGLTGLPVVLDVLGVLSPVVLGITHSPIGVAAFAVGALSVYLDRFRVVRATGDGDDPVVILDDDGRVRDFNERALRLFPALSGSVGDRLEASAPALARAVDSPDSRLEVDTGGAVRYYSVSANPLSTDRSRTGESIVLTDVTDRERYRRRLEEQNEQLERFAGIVSHDLRSPLSVAQGWTEFAIEEDDTAELPRVLEAHERMSEIIEDILTLAREGVPIDEMERVEVGETARRAWEMIAGEATLEIEGELTVEADPERLQQLFENLFRNAVEHGSTSPDSQAQRGAVEHGSTSSRPPTDDAPDLTVTVGALADRPGFFVEDDGVGIPEDVRESVFDVGFTTDESGTGFGLAIVTEIAEAHGWEVRATEGRSGGARFEIETGPPPEA